MVRLVFRPYTQIRRTICTSVSLRASTRVSPGFTLFRHRSPSFGSQQICSYSNLSQANDRSIVPLAVPTSAAETTFTFITHQGFTPKYSHICQTPWSVFQDGWMKTISSASRTQQLVHHTQYQPVAQTELCSLTRQGRQGRGTAKAGYHTSVKSNVQQEAQRSRSNPSVPKLSPTNLTDADPSSTTGPPGFRMATQHKEWDAPSRPKVSIVPDNDWLPALPS